MRPVLTCCCRRKGCRWEDWILQNAFLTDCSRTLFGSTGLARLVWLDWFGSAVSRDDEGNLIPDDRKQAARDRLFNFVGHMSDVADRMAESLKNAQLTMEIQAPPSMQKPNGVERLLYRATTEAKVFFEKESPWRVLLCLSTGGASRIGVVVHETETDET